MDKWLDLIAGETQIALGLVLNTRKLTVGIPRKYLDETLSLLSNLWHKHRERFTAIEASKMGDKLACLAEVAPRVCFLISHLYRSILSVWGQLINFFLFSFFMPDLACYQKVWVRDFYCPKMSL